MNIVISSLQEKLLDVLEKYRHLGETFFENGTLSIGKIPDHPGWFLCHLYGAISADEIDYMEGYIKKQLPVVLREFYLLMNGATLFSNLVTIWGHCGREPRNIPNYQTLSLINGHINSARRLKNIPDDAVVFGAYNGGYFFYCRASVDSVFACKEYDATPVKVWGNIEEMLFDFTNRLVPWYDSNASPVDPIVEDGCFLAESWAS